MGIAEDLLRQADHLLTYEGPNPSQASLRRAVSTAYYALFHLLLEDAGKRWQGSPEAETGIQRGYDHKSMNNISIQFRGATWKDWHGNHRPIPPPLKRVASTFTDLQDERHIADYDNNEYWSETEVRTLLDIAQSAFQDWYAVRAEPIAGNYLLAMLLKKQR